MMCQTLITYVNRLGASASDAGVDVVRQSSASICHAARQPGQGHQHHVRACLIAFIDLLTTQTLLIDRFIHHAGFFVCHLCADMIAVHVAVY